MYSEPFCQIRNCTVASANASFSSLHSLRSRRSVCDRPPSRPGSDRSMPALPASTNRSRQFPTVADETPCRRAASASDNSPFNTANTTWICSSTATCRDGFCDLLTQTPFVTGQLRTLPQSLTHLTPKLSNMHSMVDQATHGSLTLAARLWMCQGDAASVPRASNDIANERKPIRARLQEDIIEQ
jgi:hypothetical protein